MNSGEARRWIEAHFGSLARSEKSKNTPIADEEFEKALAGLRFFSLRRNKDYLTIERFLWAGCAKFDRWFAPSPPSVPKSYSRLLNEFADRLGNHERIPMNSPVFKVHALRDEVYTEFVGKKLPLGKAYMAACERFQARLDEIPVPQNDMKRSELLTAKANLRAILSGLTEGLLITKLRTTLPYPLCRQPFRLSLEWEGLSVSVKITSKFVTPREFLVQTQSPYAIRPFTSTRWQFGETRFDIEISGLIDPSIQVDPLQIPGLAVPLDFWPNGMRVAYDIIDMCCWALRGNSQYVGLWAPAPGDLSEIESAIQVAGRPEMDFIRRANPSLPVEIFLPTDEILEIEVGKVSPVSWHSRCRAAAEHYAMHGEAREAIFWLNVGVEALLRSRMDAAIAANNVNVDIDNLQGGDSYWDEAKRVLGEQFPDISEEIIWPSSRKKPSLFQQLKIFCKAVPGAPDFATVKTAYARVAQNRNDLFHGNSDATISIEDVRQALVNFDWLDQKFCNADC
ncbi:hypothetical protein [Segnochrobactrum spirostomi]|uniref:Uncharacterized protein n=1 Tax=Segnochrobactrum spirostomi TaxID=2608987 RepID=A0A6A7XYV1_9HYPH|nr:hypothetical protein [Segnochrobactrum spirostomi]MQT11488.1 hypothetical protein [Segnochrobactrum spirostomi]